MIGAVAVAAMSLAVAAATGGISIPHNDAWAYQKVAFTFFHTGNLHLVGWGQMFLVGQILAVMPLLAVLGPHASTLAVFGAIAAVAVLLLTYVLARAVAGPRRAALVTAVISVFPGFGLLASSFMTDLPCTASALACIAVGVAALRRNSTWLYVLSLLVGVWAFTIREQSVAGLAAVLATTWIWSGTPRRLRLTGTIGAPVLLLLCVALEHLRHRMPAADIPQWGLHTVRLHWPPTLTRALFTVGVALAPLAVWSLTSLRPRDLRNPGRLIGAAVGLVALAVALRGRSLDHLTLPNYLTPAGAYPDAGVGAARPVLNHRLWMVIELLGAVGGVVLAAEVGARLGPRRLGRLRTGSPYAAALAIYTALSVAGIAALSFAGQLQFDRYFVPVLVPLGILLVARPQSNRVHRVIGVTSAAAVLVVVGVVSWQITASTQLRDVARWKAATDLVRHGVPATTVNAGLEWAGTHSTTAADKTVPKSIRLGYYGQRWTALFPDSTDCWIVSLSPEGAGLQARLTREFPSRRFAPGVMRDPLFVYHRRDCSRTGLRSP